MVDLTQEEMKDTRSQLIGMLRRFRLNYRSCSICSRQLFYFMQDEQLYFSANCDCVKYYVPPELKEMSEIDALIKIYPDMVDFFITRGPEMQPYHDQKAGLADSLLIEEGNGLHFIWATKLLKLRGGIIRRPRHIFELRTEGNEYEGHDYLPDDIRYGYNDKLLPFMELELNAGKYAIKWDFMNDELYYGVQIEEFGLSIEDVYADDWEHIIC